MEWPVCRKRMEKEGGKKQKGTAVKRTEVRTGWLSHRLQM
jgi:hypothetical protein